MSGLGLVAALQNYQQGTKWANDQKQVAIDQKRQQDLQDANAAGAATIKAASDADYGNQKSAWMDGGGDPAQFQAKPFTLDGPTAIDAFHAKSAALANAGQWDDYTKNEAVAHQVRTQYRQDKLPTMLADLQATGDGASFAQNAYPLIHDGVHIVSATNDPTGGLGMAAASAQTAAGKPVAPVTVIKTSDGLTHQFTTAQLHDLGMAAIEDPTQIGKYEFEARHTNDQNAAAIKLAQAKAAADLSNGLTLGAQKNQGAMAVAGLTSNTALAVGKGHDQATLGAASIRGDASEYGADSRAEAASKRAGASGVQSRNTDANGNIFTLDKMTGKPIYLKDDDGNPIKSEAYAKRFDATKKALRNSIKYMNSSEDQLNQATLASMKGWNSLPPNPDGLSAAPGAASSPVPGLQIGARPVASAPAASVPKKLAYNPATGAIQ